jgi:hypothetical protein
MVIRDWRQHSERYLNTTEFVLRDYADVVKEEDQFI